MTNGRNDIDNDADGDEQNADWQRKTGVMQLGRFAARSQLAKKQTKARHDKTETHERDACPNPRKERALRRHVNARVALRSRRFNHTQNRRKKTGFVNKRSLKLFAALQWIASQKFRRAHPPSACALQFENPQYAFAATDDNASFVRL